MKDIEYYRKNKDTLNWGSISRLSDLSDNFIREFKDQVDWNYISIYQILSEDFIRDFEYKVNWDYISANQKLSEDFIREFQDEVGWYLISKYQKLSEDLIREFKKKVNWYYISVYQKLSEDFRKEFNILIPKTCWLYKTPEFKKNYIRENTDYSIEDGMIIAYKSVRSDGYSVYDFNYHYEVGKEYKAHCDYNIDEEDSFGLSAWTLKGARSYYDKGKIFKVGIPIEHLGAVVHSGTKLRASKIVILEEVSQ